MAAAIVKKTRKCKRPLLSDSERKRREVHRRVAIQQTCIYLGSESNRWSALKIQKQMKTDREVATFLIDHYRSSCDEQTRAMPEPPVPGPSGLHLRRYSTPRHLASTLSEVRTPSVSEVSTAESELEPHMSGVEEIQCSDDSSFKLSQDTNARTVEQCRKKFQNLKAKTMAKGAWHAPTGGGSGPELTIPEQLLFDHLVGRSMLHGIDDGTDSDGTATCSESLPVLNSNYTEEIHHATVTQPLASCSEHQSINTILVSPDAQVSRKRKRGNARDVVESVEVLTKKNLRLDCIRLQKECDKLDEERLMFQAKKENLIVKKDILSLQKQYLQTKLLTDFPSGDSFMDSMQFFEP